MLKENDSDGVHSANEFKDACHEKNSLLRAAFDKLDTSGIGYLSVESLRVALAEGKVQCAEKSSRGENILMRLRPCCESSAAQLVAVAAPKVQEKEKK